MRLLVILAALAACGKGEEAKPSTPYERAAACIDYQQSYWRTVAEATGTPQKPDFARYACADLYSKPACPAAWKDDGDRARAIAAACTAAYCDALGGKPTLCRRGPETLKPHDLVAALVELDTSILTVELGDRALAHQLAARLRLLLGSSLEVELPRPSPAADPPPQLVVTITADGAVIVGARPVDDAGIEAAVRAWADSHPDAGVVLRADSSVPYKRVVELMDAIRTAGVSQISLSTQ